jgi:hypothetical protein
LPVLGDREWTAMQMHAYRQHVSDRHSRGSEPVSMRVFLAQKCWSRIRGLMAARSANALARSDWPGSGVSGGFEGGLTLPASSADVEVAQRALNRLRAQWPVGFAAARRSLQGAPAPGDGSVLARAKLWVLAFAMEQPAETAR